MNVSIIGVLLYQATLFFQAFITRDLLRQKLYKQFPAFSCYMLFYLLETMIMFPAFIATESVSARTYADLYWTCRLIDIVLLAWVVGELCESSWLRGIGVMVSAAQLIHFHLWVDRWYTFLIAAGALACLMFRKLDPHARAIALAVFLFSVFPAIAEVASVVAPGNGILHHIPTISMLLAQLVLVRAFWLPSLKPLERG